jgi:hypothetical protein
MKEAGRSGCKLGFDSVGLESELLAIAGRERLWRNQTLITNSDSFGGIRVWD